MRFFPKILQAFGQSFKDLLPLAKTEVRSLKDRFNRLSGPQKAGVIATGAALSAAVAVTGPENVSAPVYALSQILSFAGYGLSLLSGRMTQHRHMLAGGTLAAALITAKSVILGGWSFAFMAATAAIRSAVMTLVPHEEEHKKLRNRIGFGFAAVTIPVTAAFGIFSSPWSFLTTGAMLCGTIGSTMTSGDKNDRSHYARILRVPGNLLNAMYNLFYQGSPVSAGFEALNIVNVVDKIRQTDLPRSDPQGRELSLQKSWALYVKNGFNKNKLIREGMMPSTPESFPQIQGSDIRPASLSSPG